MQDKIEVDGGRASKQKVVLGTHTSDGEQNYLMLAEVLLPTQDSETDATGYDEETHEVGGYGAAAGKVQVVMKASRQAPQHSPLLKVEGLDHRIHGWTPTIMRLYQSLNKLSPSTCKHGCCHSTEISEVCYHRVALQR